MKKHSLPGLLARVVNCPLIASPALARFYFSYLTERASLNAAVLEDGGMTPARDIVAVGKYGYMNGGPMVPMMPNTGIAVIEVSGALTHKLGEIDPYSGMTGYDGIEAKLDAAMADITVKGILLDINSGGGQVAGGFDLANKLALAGKNKPIWAVADENAFSGAYLLASQAARITTPATGQVGSIGVIAMHFDESRALANQGVEATVIKAGAQKDAFSSLKPLSDQTLAKLQGEIGDIYQMFIGAVARGRSMAADAVRGTEAAIFTAPEAKKLGLVDAVQSANDTFAEFAAALAAPVRNYSLPASTTAGSSSVAAVETEVRLEHQQEQSMTLNIKPGETAEAAVMAAATAGAAVADTVVAERNRVIAIQTMAQAGEEALSNDLIANGSSIDVAAAAFRQSRTNTREASAAVRRAETPRPLAAAPQPGAPAVDPTLPLEQRCKQEWERSADLRAEFANDFPSYYHYQKAESEGRLRNMGAFAKGKGTPLPGTAA